MNIFYNLYLLFLGLLLFIGVVFFLVERPKFKNLGQSQFNKKTKLLLYLTFFCVLFGILSPLIVIKSVLHIDKFPEPKSIQDISGPIGDTIGGLVNPFIALAAVIVTGLAFYMQYEANKQARQQFNDNLEFQKGQLENEITFEKIKKGEDDFNRNLTRTQESFERQFFELLRLHKENVNELSIEIDKKSASSGKNIVGRRVFILFKNELHLTYGLFLKIYKYKYSNYKGKFNIRIFKLSYYVFFEGFNSFNKINSNILSQEFDLDKHFIDFLKKTLFHTRDLYDQSKVQQEFYDYSLSPPTLITTQHFQYLPFVGQESRLGHYFRHLFLMLKFVSDQNTHIIDYSKKRYFLRILRAQLSNHEQVLLFYNWFSDYGNSWEEKSYNNRINRIGNYFFTDFRMIHNLDESKLIKGIKLNKIFGRKDYKDFLYEENRKFKDILFEIHGYQSLLSEVENRRLIS